MFSPLPPLQQDNREAQLFPDSRFLLSNLEVRGLRQLLLYQVDCAHIHDRTQSRLVQWVPTPLPPEIALKVHRILLKYR